MKMEQTECAEKAGIQNSEAGESPKRNSRLINSENSGFRAALVCGAVGTDAWNKDIFVQHAFTSTTAPRAYVHPVLLLPLN